MPNNSAIKQADSGRSPVKGRVAYVLPLFLLLAFLGRQLGNLDGLGWVSGFSHPLTGWDHLLTMLAVGVWAAQLRGQAVWMLPLAFVTVMSLGGLAGASGIAIPSVEGIILLSCAVFSVLITRKIRFSAKINVLIVAFFAFFHGFAHGQEISTSASLISYTLGFMLATLMLHGAGILIARLLVIIFGCMLTILFSSATLAEADDSIDDIEFRKIALAHSKNTPFRIAGGQHGCFAPHQVGICAESLAGQGVAAFSDAEMSAGLDAPRPVIANSLPKTCHAQVGANGNPPVSGLTPASFQSLNKHYRMDFPLFNSDYLVRSAPDFRHYYPDINHTPGKHSLSSGVGLASPPVPAVNVIAPPVLSRSSHTPIPAIADLHLQSSFAEISAGNLHRFTTGHDKHRYPGRQFTAADASSLNDSASCSRPIVVLTQACVLVKAHIAGLEPVFAYRQYQPLLLSRNGRQPLLPSIHNKNNQRGVST